MELTPFHTNLFEINEILYHRWGDKLTEEDQRKIIAMFYYKAMTKEEEILLFTVLVWARVPFVFQFPWNREHLKDSCYYNYPANVDHVVEYSRIQPGSKRFRKAYSNFINGRTFPEPKGKWLKATNEDFKLLKV